MGQRPRIPEGARELIAQMSQENRCWAARRIQGELRAPGYEVSAETVRRHGSRRCAAVSVLNDQDGPGGNAPTTTGPVTADVEIVEVLALAPLGEGPLLTSAVWLQGAVIALAAALLLGGRYATLRLRA